MFHLRFQIIICAGLLVLTGITKSNTFEHNISTQELKLSCRPSKLMTTSWKTKLNLIDKYIPYDSDCKSMQCNNANWSLIGTKHILSLGNLYFDTNKLPSTRLCLQNLTHFEAKLPFFQNDEDVLFEFKSTLKMNEVIESHILRNDTVNCEINSCKNGGICVLNQCNCLLHFEGQYCSETIDYCLSGPCYFGSSCFSRLGGYWCICPPKYIGINCNTVLALENIKPVINFDVIYSPLQYYGIDSSFGIFATSLGTGFKLYINFNNETKTLMNAQSFRYYKDGRSTLLKYFPLLVHKESGGIYLHIHKLTFIKMGLFNLFIAIKNGPYLTFKSLYEIRVIEAKCKLIVSVDNLSNSKNNGVPRVTFRKRDEIYFKSNVYSNCIHAKLVFHWAIVYTNESKVLQNVVIGDHLELPYLIIPPYTLHEGQYYVRLKVSISSPVHLIKNQTKIHVNITSEPLNVKILGGVDIINHWEKSLSLDGTKSWNPNTKESESQNLTYKWQCFIIDPEVYPLKYSSDEIYHFCHGLHSTLNTSAPYLLIPEKRLQLNYVYAFVLYLYETTESSLLSDAVQIVHIQSEMVPLLRLNCVHNCESKFSNPNEVTEIEATCLTCNKSNQLENMHWIVSCKENSLKDASRIVEFSLIHGHLIVYENSFKAGEHCKVQFEAESRSKGNQERIFGTVTLLLYMYSSPTIGSCVVTPTFGYGYLTEFNIMCKNFEDKNLPLIYEAAQFRIKQNSNGLIVAYGYFPEMYNVTLCAGLALNNFVTVLRIIATNPYGLYSFTEVLVTVLPPNFIVRNPFIALKKVKGIISGEESEMGQLISTKNYYKICQKILSMSVSLNDLMFEYLNNSKIFSIDINVIGRILVHYLNAIPIISIGDSKIVITGLFMIVKLLKYDLQQNACESKTNILQTIANHLGVKNKNIPFVDIQDIGILILSISSVLFHHCNVTIDRLPQVPIVLDILFQFSRLYFKKLVLNQRPHLISSQTDNLHVLLQRGNPKHISTQLFFIDHYGSIKLIIKKNFYQQNITLDTLLMYSLVNPVQSEEYTSNFPYITVNVMNFNKQIKSVPFVASLMYTNKSGNEISPVKGNIYYQSNWTEQQKIHITRVRVNVDGKILIKFFNIPERVTFLVVVKVNIRPVLQNFQDEPLTIPQETSDSESDKNSILVSDNIKNTSSILYIGIIPINKHGSERKRVEHNENGIKKNEEGLFNITYGFVALNVKCKNWDGLRKKWEEDCKVLSKSLFNTITCFCPNQTTVTAKYIQLPVLDDNIPPDNIYPANNTFILFIILFFLILYIVLLFYALNRDRKSNLGRDVIDLNVKRIDYKHIYLVKLTTGRDPGMNTSSNISIQFEGDEGISCLYNITDNTSYMDLGPEHWFVLKDKFLGDIFCIHLFSDYYGRKPSWYCSEVLVHDIQTHFVYLFRPNLKLGDNKQNCSVFVIPYPKLFKRSVRFVQNIKITIGLGYNCWLAMFYKHPSSNYTYVQRTTMAFFYIIVTNLTSIYLYKDGQKEELGRNLYLFYAAIITSTTVFSVYLIISNIFIYTDSRIRPERAYKGVLEIYEKDQLLGNTKIKIINLKDYLYNEFGNELKLQIRINGLLGCPETLTRFNLPYGCLYITMFLLLSCLFLSMYLSVLWSLDFSNNLLVDSLFCLILSVGISFLIFEPVKTLIVASYFTWRGPVRLTVENRSDDAYRALYYKHKPRSKKQSQDNFKLTRELTKPFIQIMKTAQKSCIIKTLNICLYIILFIILMVLKIGMMDPYSYNNLQNIYSVLLEKNQMNTIDELYLNLATHFMPVVHNFSNISNVNNLIGIPRLRQLRRSTNKCTKRYENLRKWTELCFRDYNYFEGDSADYGESWGLFYNSVEWKNSYPWKFSSQQYSSLVRGNLTLYSGGGYIANLGPNLEQSLNNLQYLVDTGWLDERTQTLFMEFPLYNPQQNIISELCIIFERCLLNKFVVNVAGDSLIIRSIFTVKNVGILTIIVIFILAFIIISIKECIAAFKNCQKHTALKLKTTSLIFILIGVLIIFFYLNIIKMNDFIKLQITKIGIGSYLHFRLNEFLSTPLLITCTFMLVFITLKCLSIITKYPAVLRTNVILKNAVRQILPLIITFAVYFICFLAAIFVILYVTFGFNSLYKENTSNINFCLSIYRIAIINLPGNNVTLLKTVSALFVWGIILTFILLVMAYVKSIFLINRRIIHYTPLSFMSQSLTKSEIIMGYLVQYIILAKHGYKLKASSYVGETMLRTIVAERVKYHIKGIKTMFAKHNEKRPENLSFELYRTTYFLDNKFLHIMENFGNIKK